MFQATSQFSLKFCITFQCHDIIPLKFSTWNITLWTKRAHQSTNFQIFECFNESSPNSSCQFWNHKVKAYSNLTSPFSVMRNKSSVQFQLKMYMLWTKGAHQSAKFQTFDCLRKISPNLYFDRLLLLKVYKILAEKVQRSYVSWPWRLMQNLKKNWSVVSKMTRIWWNLTRALKSLQNLHFYLLLLCKVFNVWPKKVQRSYLSWHWRVMQNLKKNWLVAWKMTWGIWQIFTRALESVKIGTLMGSFCPK